MIKSFRCKETKKLYERSQSRKFASIERMARRRPYWLDSVCSLAELAALPGARLERLEGDRKDQFSIRINRQWRICFRWEEGDAYGVEIVDYH